MHLLLIEDDEAMQATLQRTLSRRGFSISAVTDGRKALGAWKQLNPDVVLLDLSLPGMDGLDILSSARSNRLHQPVLILTARGTVGDRVLGLNTGADDYLAKPFDLDELEARIRALVRRQAPQALAATGQRPPANELLFDEANSAFYWQGSVMELSPREVSFLKTLQAAMGQAVTKERLFSAVFAHESDAQIDAVEVIAYRVRKKLAATNLQLMTLRGLGYLLKKHAAP